MNSVISTSNNLVPLGITEQEEVSGGIPYTMAARAALLDTASLSPLLFAFSVGYTIGTLGYATYRQIYGY